MIHVLFLLNILFTYCFSSSYFFLFLRAQRYIMRKQQPKITSKKLSPLVQRRLQLCDTYKINKYVMLDGGQQTSSAAVNISPPRENAMYTVLFMRVQYYVSNCNVLIFMFFYLFPFIYVYYLLCTFVYVFTAFFLPFVWLFMFTLTSKQQKDYVLPANRRVYVLPAFAGQQQQKQCPTDIFGRLFITYAY